MWRFTFTSYEIWPNACKLKVVEPFPTSQIILLRNCSGLKSIRLFKQLLFTDWIWQLEMSPLILNGYMVEFMYIFSSNATIFVVFLGLDHTHPDLKANYVGDYLLLNSLALIFDYIFQQTMLSRKILICIVVKGVGVNNSSESLPHLVRMSRNLSESFGIFRDSR